MFTISTISTTNNEGPCFVPSSYTHKRCQIPNHGFSASRKSSALWFAVLSLAFCVASLFPHCHFSNPEILLHALYKRMAACTYTNTLQKGPNTDDFICLSLLRIHHICRTSFVHQLSRNHWSMFSTSVPLNYNKWNDQLTRLAFSYICSRKF